MLDFGPATFDAFPKQISTQLSPCCSGSVSNLWQINAQMNSLEDSDNGVGIARALIQNPELLLVDEPTASLDPKTSRQIMRLITELCTERKLAAIINIHDVALAQMFAQRIVGLQSGSIVYDGSPEGLTPEVLTQIYGEEDWTAVRKRKDSESHQEVDDLEENL